MDNDLDEIKYNRTHTEAGELRKDHELRNLCLWIERELLKYDQNQALNTMSVLKIGGLRNGKIIDNNGIESFGNYPIEVIAMTFKKNKQKILNAIKSKSFDTEEGEIGYICAIVRKDLNNMYIRWKSAKNTKLKIDNINIDVITSNNAEYKVKEKTEADKRKENKFRDLW